MSAPAISPNSGELSGPRWNAIVDAIVRINPKTGEPEGWLFEQVEKLTTKLLEDGYPPFSEPVGDPYLEYLRLLVWRSMGDPRYTSDPNAQAALAELEQRYGAAPPMFLNPLGGQIA